MTSPWLLTAILALSAASSAAAYDHQFFQPQPSSWIIAVPSSDTAQLTRSSNSGGDDVARFLRIQPSSGGSDSGGSPPSWFRQSHEGGSGGGGSGTWSQKWRQDQEDGRSKSTAADYGGQLPSWKQSSQQSASRRTNSGRDDDDDDDDYVVPQRRYKDQRIKEPGYGYDGDDGGSRKPNPPRRGPPPPPGPGRHGPPPPPPGPRHHGPPSEPRRGPGPRAGPPPPPPPPHHRRPRPPPPPPREE